MVLESKIISISFMEHVGLISIYSGRWCLHLFVRTDCILWGRRVTCFGELPVGALYGFGPFAMLTRLY